VFFFELVLDRVRRGVAPQPELFDELLALFVRLQPFERRPLLIGNDVSDVLVQPLLVRSFQLFAERGFLFLLFLLGQRLGNRFAVGGLLLLFGILGGLGVVGKTAQQK